MKILLSLLRFRPTTTQWFFIGLTFLNLILFIGVNLKPIAWRHNEITHFNFLWSKSLDKTDPYTLQTGLNVSDFQKLFFLNDLDEGLARFRQFSYLIEMTSFKLWQNLEITTFHNPTLILLHLFNTLFFWLLMRTMTSNNAIALACSLLFLNSGQALSTLLFNSRVPKFLLVFLFFASWFITNQRVRPSLSWFKYICLSLMLLLMLFTDEMAVFLIALIFLIFRFKNKPRHQILELLFCSILALAACFILGKVSLSIAHHMHQSSANVAFAQLKSLQKYYSNFSFLEDTLRAFTSYFLRRHFGYWDLSFWGGLSFICFSTILLFAFKNNLLKRSLKYFFIIIGIILLKAFLFPHAHGVHVAIMGNQTIFPTVLFFNYYYTYIDSLLFIVALVFLFSSWPSKQNYVPFVLLTCVTIINISNVIHADEGIKDALKQHSYYQTEYRNISKIYDLQQLKNLAKEFPIYLSFPSGSQPIFKRFLSTESQGWKMDPEAQKQGLLLDFVDYGSIVSTQYLKLIEERKFIVSLQNSPSMRTFQKNHELLSASYFYDAHRQEFFDLNQIQQYTKVNPIDLSNKPMIQEINLTAYPNPRELIFFVKGSARILIKGNNLILNDLKQNYGYSYQIFRIPLKDIKNKRISLHILPLKNNSPIAFWGAFIGQELTNGEDVQYVSVAN